jgi:hypothetical protein
VTAFLFALRGDSSKELISYGGRVLTHDNKDELEFLFPRMEVIKIPALPDGRPTMSVKNHPELAGLTWPLDRGEFI